MPPPANKRQQPQDDAAPRPKRLKHETRQEGAATKKKRDRVQNNTSPPQKICLECRKIDFERFINEGAALMTGKERRGFPGWNPTIAVRHIGPQRACPLCQLFYQARHPDEDGIAYQLQTYELRLLDANTVFGTREASVHVEDAPAFTVRPHGPFTIEHAPGIIMVRQEGANGLVARQLQPKVDVSLVAEWLSFCDLNHKVCNQTDPPIPPGFRVLDCSTRTILEWDDVPCPKQYVTLSYVWGKERDETASCQGAVPNSLPRTIDDSVALSSSLGYPYIWIDRYCIPQDNAKTKHLQIQNMDVIYQHSVLTIIAAAGEDPITVFPALEKRQGNPSCA